MRYGRLIGLGFGFWAGSVRFVGRKAVVGLSSLIGRSEGTESVAKARLLRSHTKEHAVLGLERLLEIGPTTALGGPESLVSSDAVGQYEEAGCDHSILEKGMP